MPVRLDVEVVGRGHAAQRCGMVRRRASAPSVGFPRPAGRQGESLAKLAAAMSRSPAAANPANAAFDRRFKPSVIARLLGEYVIGQEEAKRTLAVAVYTHYRKLALTDAEIIKSNVLLIGPTGTGKTLMCATLARVLGVPFVTADATTLAQTRYVADEIEAVLERLVDNAGGDARRAQHGIVFIDEVDKLKLAHAERGGASAESVQHALLKIMEGAPVRLRGGAQLDTSRVLFICGGTFVGLAEIIASQHSFGVVSTTGADSRKIMERLNSHVKPTDLVSYGLIPEFVGRLTVVARFGNLGRDELVRIMTEPRQSIYGQFRAIFAGEGVELAVAPRVFAEIADLAIEYKTGARSLRGLFEEMVGPVLFAIPDRPDVKRVEFDSLYDEPRLVAGAGGA
jgi:ATP-dependent Clp protease ATP-binding subunit ClpX